MAALTIGGSFLSASLQVLFDKLSSPAMLELGLVWGVKNELSKLRRTLMKIISVVSDTEMREIRDQVAKVWLKELKEVAYDAENILEEFEAEVVRQRVENGSSTSYLSSLTPNQVLFRLDISRKISIVRERLDDVAKDNDYLRLGELLDTRKQVDTFKQRESSSLLCRSLIFGRDKDCDSIIEMLFSENKNGSNDVIIPAVIITGIGGIGKTALAKLIYNDERISNNFQLKIWVHVSENFDVRRITREIMESCSEKGCSDFVNWNMIQEKLKDQIQGKQFLLVLDDVWDDDRSKWEQLCLPFVFANYRSRLLITTRNANVLNSTMTTLYSLEVLTDEECWKIFKTNAFINGMSDNHPKLEVIGKDIVKKLQGLPLAAKAVGGLLYSKLDKESWKVILESELWEYPKCGKDIFSSLKISYRHLPAHLKQCYGYCSLFPKDYEFEKDKLIHIWNAQGFIPPRGERHIEDIASECFNELLSKSFFKRFEESYLMHDMIHDLARYVSLDECFRVHDSKLHQIPENARHLSLLCNKMDATIFNELSRFKSLRTLLLQGCSSGFNYIPDGLFIKLRYIRVLDLSSNGIKEVPDSIDSLKQLRYLDLSKNNIVKLPESIGSLYNLQTLNLDACELDELPRTMANMFKLRHLKVKDDELVSTISNIGKLVNLQELVKFNVHDKDGHRITELKNMTVLQKIHISKLESIHSKEEAQESKLNNKKFLRILTLEWSYNRGAIAKEVLEMEVLEGLQPHQNLSELKIWDNAGFRPPSWLTNHFLFNIEAISIGNCKNWEELPPFGDLQFLRFLELSGMNNVKQVSHHFYGGNQKRFPSLIELRLIDMPELREWLWLNKDEDNLFPCLQELLLVSCPKLERLPPLPPTLARLWMRKTGLKIVPDLSTNCQIDRNKNSSTPSLLSTMNISECPNLTSLKDGLLRHQLIYLETLSITNCAELTIPDEDDDIPALATLKTLTIDNCPKLTALIDSGLPPRLAHLKFGGSPSLKFNCLQNLTSLYSLSISDCPCIASLSEESLCNLIALEELLISSCKELRSLHLGALISLKRLTVENCPLLEYSSLPRSSSLEYLELNNVLTVSGLLQNLTSLLSLRIQNCPQLTSFSEEEELEKLILLQSLHILDCYNLFSLPTKLHKLESLERMYLQNCPRVHSLPESGLPGSLKLIDIRGCPILERHCRKGGQDWHKIAHISDTHNA